MGSNYHGEPNLGNERGGGSSRKSKKSNKDKPKQPQRGLGVAKLEKIRLHEELGSSTYFPSLNGPYPTNFTQDDTRVQAAYSSLPSSSSYYTSSSSSNPSASYGFYTTMMMGLGDYERTNMRYGDSLPSTTASWSPGSSILEAQHYPQPSTTRHFFSPLVEDTQQTKNKKHRSDSVESSSHNSESSDAQELDLDLKLSL